MAWNVLAPGHLRFDPYPFGLLTMAVSMEGVLLAILVLITQNRMSAQSDRRDHLDLQIDLLAEQEMTVVLRLLARISERLGLPVDEREPHDARKLMDPTDIDALMRALGDRHDPALRGAAGVSGRTCEPGAGWMDVMRRGDFDAAWSLGDAGLATIPGDDGVVPATSSGSGAARRSTSATSSSAATTDSATPCSSRATCRLVCARAREVTLWVQPALIPLLSLTPRLGQLSPLHDGVPGERFDVDVEIMELPHVFRTTLETIPNQVPYLRVPSVREIPPLTDDDERLTVGLAWRAGTWDPRRSIELAAFGRLLESPELRVIPLHDRRAAEEAAFTPVQPPRPLDRLAALISQCDVVISVDTMAAHLAGALGVPTCLLLHTEADWRWMRRRADSPWYPTMTLFRQHRPGEWDAPIAAVFEDVMLRARSRAQRARGARPPATRA